MSIINLCDEELAKVAGGATFTDCFVFSMDDRGGQPIAKASFTVPREINPRAPNLECNTFQGP